MNWLDLIIAVCAIIGLIKGLFDGMIKQVISLISLALAILFSGVIAKPIRDYLVQIDFINNFFSPAILTDICYLLAFILIFWGLNFAGKALSEIIKYTPMFFPNAFFGGLAGMFVALLSLSLFFNLLSAIDSKDYFISKQTKEESILYYKTKGVVPLVYPFIKSYFDIDHIKEQLIPKPTKEEERPIEAITV